MSVLKETCAHEFCSGTSGGRKGKREPADRDLPGMAIKTEPGRGVNKLKYK